ncbi:hypothetical protein D3I60_00025 [Brevibacterium permense]|nr:hypothetical protein [Brevibacterium permense]
MNAGLGDTGRLVELGQIWQRATVVVFVVGGAVAEQCREVRLQQATASGLGGGQRFQGIGHCLHELRAPGWFGPTDRGVELHRVGDDERHQPGIEIADDAGLPASLDTGRDDLGESARLRMR